MLYTYLKKYRERFISPMIINVFWLSLDKMLRLIIGLVVGVWVARYLGPAAWGRLNYILAIVSILIPFCNLGLDSYLVKSIVQNPETRYEYLGTAFVIRLLVLPVAAISACLFMLFTGAPYSDFVLLALLSFNFLISPLDLIDVDFQSRLQSKLTVISKNAAYLIGAAVKIYLIVHQKSLVWFAAVMGLETLLSYLFLIGNYQYRYNLLAWKFDPKLIRLLVRTCWPFAISNITVILYMRIDQLMIAELAGTEQVGIFTSVVRVSELFLFVPLAIATSYLPTLVRSKNEMAYSVFMDRMQVFMNWMSRVSIAASLLVTLSAQQIIAVLFGPEFESASDVLIIYIWSIIPVYLGVAASQYMVIENLQKYTLLKTLGGLVMNVAMNLMLIPGYGAKGAAIATLFSYLVSAILSNAFFDATSPIFQLQLKSFRMLFRIGK